ncbi:MAG: hypothetical protein GX556_10700 [Fibrobacter sp.]|nr:hypothetical protein [Fibrobacter sp.]
MIRIIGIVLAFVSFTFAFNHPEIRWESVSTDHFQINFYDATEPSVYAAWKIAEETFDALSELYNFKPEHRINITLAEYDDYSNGWADWTSGNIMIWIPDSRFDLRGNTTWLRNVITHELTHIISLEQKKKLFDVVLSFGLNTPDEKITVQEPFATVALYPSWLSEGIAQLETEKLGHDCWDSRREMVLKCAALEGRLLSLEEMGHFNHDALGAEMVYNQGFSFCKHIERKAGADVLRGIFKQGSKGPFNLKSFISTHTGYTLEQLYREWADSLKESFGNSVSSEQDIYKPLWRRGRFNLFPQVSADGKFAGWFTSHKDDGSRTDLIITDYGQSSTKTRIPYAHSSLSFSGSKTVYYLKSRSPDRHGSYFNDIYSFNIEEGVEKRLTSGARVYALAASPDNRNIACIRYKSGIFSVEMFDIESGTFHKLYAGEKGIPFMHLSFNPADRSALTVSRIIDGKSRIFTLSLDDKELAPLTPGFAHEESPCWARDGRIYYSADYDRSFQIYSVLPDGSDLMKHTSVTGGAFSPCVDTEGNLVLSSYSASGFSIAQIKPSAVPFEVTQDSGCSFLPLPVPRGKVRIQSSPYQPVKLKPLLEIQLVGDISRTRSLMTNQFTSEPDVTQFLFGGRILRTQSDALQKSNRYLSLGAGLIGLKGSDDEIDSMTSNRSVFQSKDFAVEQFRNNQSKVTESIRERAGAWPRDKNIVREISKSAQEGGDDSSTFSPNVAPVFFPGIGWENSFSSATLGLELTSYMLLFIPVDISATGYMQWHLARDLYMGVAPQISVITDPGAVAARIPFSFEWNINGYVNEDIAYNLGDITYLSILAGPQFIRSWKIGRDGDTTLLVPSGLMGGVQVFRGFPVGRYGSIQLSNVEMINYFNRDVLDENAILDGHSRTYMSSQTGLKTVFPLARDINRGTLYYFDALYGYVGYNFQVYANAQFFESLSEYGRKLVTDPQYTPYAAVGHFVNAGLQLGHYKSYAFNRSLKLDFSYEILRRYFTFSIGAGF